MVIELKGRGETGNVGRVVLRIIVQVGLSLMHRVPVGITKANPKTAQTGQVRVSRVIASMVNRGELELGLIVVRLGLGYIEIKGRGRVDAGNRRRATFVRIQNRFKLDLP